MDQMRDQYELGALCAALEVSSSGYFDWKRRSPSARALANVQLLVQIRAIHAETRAAYGSPRIWRSLRERGLRVGREPDAQLLADDDLDP